MIGNGVRTDGMIATKVLQLQAVPGKKVVAQVGSYVEAVGETIQRAHDLQIEVTTIKTIIAIALVSVFLWKLNHKINSIQTCFL